MSHRLALPFVALVAVAASAQPAAVPSQPQGGAPRSYPGVSVPGNAILAQSQQSPDPQYIVALRQMRALSQQLNAATTAPTVDVDRVAALLKQMEPLQAQLATRSNDRLVAALRQLPAADRAPFLRAVAAPAGSRR